MAVCSRPPASRARLLIRCPDSCWGMRDSAAACKHMYTVERDSQRVIWESHSLGAPQVDQENCARTSRKLRKMSGRKGIWTWLWKQSRV